MTRTISDILMAERRQPIEYDGRSVYGRFPLEVQEKQRLVLRLQFNRPDLRQAVSVKIEKGTIELDEQQMKGVMLWCDTAPPEVELVCHPGKRIETATLWVWNHWESDNGRADAGLNNAGMVVDEVSPERIVLACSPGRRASEPPDFDAVRVEILIDPPRPAETNMPDRA
jgi:hypothetical protein